MFTKFIIEDFDVPLCYITYDGEHFLQDCQTPQNLRKLRSLAC